MPAHKPSAGGKGLLAQFLEEARRSVESAERPQSRPGVQPRPTKLSGPQIAIQKPADPANQPVMLPAVEPPREPKLSILTPEIRPTAQRPPKLGHGIQEMPDFTRKTLEQFEHKGVSISAEIPETKYLSELLLDYADPEQLRRAILHYEILGKPLSLRD